MKVAGLRQKDMLALNALLLDLLREQFNLRMQKVTEQLSKTSEIRRVRREIATVKTIITEKMDANK